MSKPQVFVTRKLTNEVIAMLETVADVKQWEEDTPVPREKLLEEIEHADAVLTMLTERVDEELLARAKRLRVVANMAVGYDNIDVPACKRRGIAVTNTPDVLTEATA
ncbi:D-glycerate dehydrogenase, partial [Mesorhizobium sp. M00.F.Ca.ET.186.01.1.1]